MGGRGGDPVKSVAAERKTMKRTDITELFPEASKEAIDKLMAINGADVNSAKGNLGTLTAELEAAKSELSLRALGP